MEIQSCFHKEWQLTWQCGARAVPWRARSLRAYFQKALALIAQSSARRNSFTPVWALPDTKFLLQVTFCGKQKIKALNRDFRGQDKVTDVLTFPTQKPKWWRNHQYRLPILHWGDVVICLPQAARQAKEHQRSLEAEILYLFLHSWLHLYGHDHQTPRQTAEMFWQQDQLYARIIKTEKKETKVRKLTRVRKRTRTAKLKRKLKLNLQ